MIKYFCDRCGKEMEKGRKMYIGVYDALGAFITQLGQPKHICEECSAKLDAIKNQLEHEEDIFDMSDEDIELLRYTFKVGDKVITDDGRTGIITDICDCDRCKKRGFYEPRVKMTIGNGQIWITDTDKENGFISFYQIGDQIFGNVDEDATERIRQRIVELRHELTEYESQLNMLKSLTN